MRSFCKAIICEEKASVERNDVDIHLYLRMSDYDVQRTKDEGMKLYCPTDEKLFVGRMRMILLLGHVSLIGMQSSHILLEYKYIFRMEQPRRKPDNSVGPVCDRRIIHDCLQ